MSNSLEAIRYTRGKLEVLDQLRLPHEHHYDDVLTSEAAFDCIRSMRVRGAPAIAIVASLALAVELHQGQFGMCSRTVWKLQNQQDFNSSSGRLRRGDRCLH